MIIYYNINIYYIQIEIKDIGIIHKNLFSKKWISKNLQCPNNINIFSVDCKIKILQIRGLTLSPFSSIRSYYTPLILQKNNKFEWKISTNLLSNCIKLMYAMILY